MMQSPYFGSQTRSAAAGSGKGQLPSSRGQPERGHHGPCATDSPAGGKSGTRRSHGGPDSCDLDSHTESDGQTGIGVRRERDTVRLDPEELLFSGSVIHIGGDGLACDYIRAFRAAEADRLLEECEKQIEYMADEEARVRVFGTWHSLPRQQSAYGDPGVTYRYSGSTLLARPWCPVLSEIRACVESLTEQRYNFVLINRYRDGRDHIGEHRDDEKELVRHSAIVSVSLGACRDFCFRRRPPRGGRRLASARPQQAHSAGRDSADSAELPLSALSARHGHNDASYDRDGDSDGRERAREASGTVRMRAPRLDGRSDDRDGASVNGSVVNETPSASWSPNSKLKCAGEDRATGTTVTVSEDRLVMPLEHGSVLVMKWPTNEEWNHALPPRRRDRNVRVNLTYRLVQARATPL